MRIARTGYLLLAALVCLNFALGLASRWLWEESNHDIDGLALVNNLQLVLTLLWALATFAVSWLPRSTGARGLATAAAALTGLDTCIDLAFRFAMAPSSMSIDTLERVTRVRGWAQIGVSVGFAVLFALAGSRVARAAGARWAQGLVFAGLGLGVAGSGYNAAAWLDLDLPGVVIVSWAHGAVFAATCVVLGWLLGRVPVAPPDEVSRSGLDPAWRGVAAGIRIVLVAIGARIVFAVWAILVMRGAGEAQDFYDLQRAGESVLGVAVLSGAAGLLLAVGLFRISRAPMGAGSAAMLALLLLFAGIAVDAFATKMTLDAFKSVSAAFLAQDTLPGLAALASALGVAAGASFLSSLGGCARSLERPDVATYASSTITLLVIGGVGAGTLQLLASHIPIGVFLVGAAIALPVLLVVAVRVLVVAIRVMREIDARAG